MKNSILYFLAISAFSLAFISQKEVAHWQILKTKNQANGRSECGMAACNGKLYLMGGDAKDVEVFDPKTLTWTKKTAAPLGMNHFQAVSFQHKIYVLEAFSGGGFPDQSNMANVQIYDTEKNTWQAGVEIPAERQRAAAGAATYNGKIYLVAGIQHGHSSGTTNLFDEYNPTTNTWKALPDAPHIRDHCSAAVIKDKLYVAGGRNTSFHEPNNFMAFMSKTVLEVDCFDFKTGQWTTLSAKLPLGSGGGALVNLNDKLVYMGGERATATEQNRPRDNTFFLDPSTANEWQETDHLKNARNGMSAAVIGNKIYAFGGAGGGMGSPPPPMPNMPNDSLRRPPMGNPPPPPQGGQRRESPSPLEVFSF